MSIGVAVGAANCVGVALGTVVGVGVAVGITCVGVCKGTRVQVDVGVGVASFRVATSSIAGVGVGVGKGAGRHAAAVKASSSPTARSQEITHDSRLKPSTCFITFLPVADVQNWLVGGPSRFELFSTSPTHRKAIH